MTATSQQPGGAPATESPPSRGRHASELPSADDRGGLEVAALVVRKVAERAADLTPGTLPSPHRLVGTRRRGAQAKIDGEGSTVTVALQLALRYPSPIRELSEAVRKHVSDEVQRITGYRVAGVRITVSALLPEAHTRVE